MLVAGQFFVLLRGRVRRGKLTDIEDDPDDQEQWQELSRQDGQHRLECQSEGEEGDIVERPIHDESAEVVVGCSVRG